MDRYVPNPKHKEPWPRGKKGTLCGDADGPGLFAGATPDPANPNRRWATDGLRFYEAKSSRHPDANGHLDWHGYPVPAMDVPRPVMEAWVAAGAVSRRASRATS